MCDDTTGNVAEGLSVSYNDLTDEIEDEEMGSWRDFEGLYILEKVFDGISAVFFASQAHDTHRHVEH